MKQEDSCSYKKYTTEGGNVRASMKRGCKNCNHLWMITESQALLLTFDLYPLRCPDCEQLRNAHTELLKRYQKGNWHEEHHL